MDIPEYAVTMDAMAARMEVVVNVAIVRVVLDLDGGSGSST